MKKYSLIIVGGCTLQEDTRYTYKAAKAFTVESDYYCPLEDLTTEINEMIENGGGFIRLTGEFDAVNEFGNEYNAVKNPEIWVSKYCAGYVLIDNNVFVDAEKGESIEGKIIDGAISDDIAEWLEFEGLI